MFRAKVLVKDSEDILLEVESENRNYMRGLKLLCEENNLDCRVEEEVKPRVVKFKGVD